MSYVVPGSVSTEAIDDRVAALAIPGTGMSITYDDAANTLTFANVSSFLADYISIESYCAEGAGNSAGNLAGLRSAVAAAIAAGKQLFVPRGRWEFDLTTADYAVDIDGDLTMFGVGTESILKFLPEAPFAAGFDTSVNATAGIFKVATDVDVRFCLKGLHFMSFDSPDFTKVDSGGVREQWNLIRPYPGTPSTTPDGVSFKILIDECYSTGYWAYIVESSRYSNNISTRRDYIALRNCHMECVGVVYAGAHGVASVDATIMVHAANCEFISKWDDSTSATGRAFYIASTVALNIDTCDFEGYLTCVRHSESDTNFGGFPSAISNCTARRGQTGSDFFAGASGSSRAQITGCSIAEGIETFIKGTQGSVTAEGCMVWCPAMIGGTTGDAEPSAYQKVIFRNCNFGKLTTPCQFGTIQAGETRLENCFIEFDNTGDTALQVISDGDLYFKACAIRLTDGSRLYDMAVTAGEVVNVYFDNCEVTAAGAGPLINQDTGDTCTLHLRDNRFVNSGTRTFFQNNGAVMTDKIRGEGNEFTGFDPFLTLGGSGSGFALQRILGRARAYSSTKASAATLVLDDSHDLFRITGTTTIDNIYLHSDATTRANSLKFFSGSRVTLIPTGAWDLSNAGNIVATAGARTVNRPVTLHYEANIGKWMEH